MPRTRHIFSISFQPEIDCTTFHSLFSVFEKEKLAGLWLVAKWLIMLGFMGLGRPRVFRRSNIGFVSYYRYYLWAMSCITSLLWCPQRKNTESTTWFVASNTSYLCRVHWYWGRNKMADDIFKRIILNENVRISINISLNWSMFLTVQLTIFQHLFRQWPGADQATSHYLNNDGWFTDAYMRRTALLSSNTILCVYDRCLCMLGLCLFSFICKLHLYFAGLKTMFRRIEFTNANASIVYDTNTAQICQNTLHKTN